MNYCYDTTHDGFENIIIFIVRHKNISPVQIITAGDGNVPAERLNRNYKTAADRPRAPGRERREKSGAFAGRGLLTRTVIFYPVKLTSFRALFRHKTKLRFGCHRGTVGVMYTLLGLLVICNDYCGLEIIITSL